MTMRVWTVITQKGGAGKTTTATNLAVVASERGERALLIDCDDQGSATSWWESRGGDEDKPYAIRAAPTEVRADIERARELGFTQVIIDTPGFAGLRATEAASASTFAIVPCQPSVADMRSTFVTARLLKDLAVPFAFLLTRCPPSGQEVLEARDAFRSVGLVCDTAVGERKGHKRAYAMGLGITEYAETVDRSAIRGAEESRAIYDWVLAKERRLSGSVGLGAPTRPPSEYRAEPEVLS